MLGYKLFPGIYDFSGILGTLGRDDILDKKINFQNLYILILIMLIWVIMKWNVKKIGCYLVSVLNERLSKFFNLHCFQSDESVKFLWIQNKKNHYIWNLNLCNYKIQKIEVCFWYMVQNTSGSQLFGLYLNYPEGEKLDLSYFVEIFYRLILCCFVKVFGKFQQFSKNPETGPTREICF